LHKLDVLARNTGNLLLQLWTADDVDFGRWRAGMGVTLLVATLAISWRWGGCIGRLAAWHVVVTLGIALVLSVVWKPIVVLRYFVPAQALLLCGLAAAWPAQSWIGRAVTLNLVATSLVLVAGLWPRLDPPPNVEGIRGAVAWVDSQRQSNDVVLVQRPFLYLPWRYYDRRSASYLTDAAVSRLTHYEGLPLLEPHERVGGDAPARVASSVWFIREAYSHAEVPSDDMAHWKRRESRRFLEAFSWQSPIVVEHWVRERQE
jgi:hypothetical protein